jgi:hypothetical protein
LAGSEVWKIRRTLESEIPNIRIIECHSFGPRNQSAAERTWQEAVRECQKHISQQGGGSRS